MAEDFSKYNGEGTQLRKAQLRMLDILVDVDKICRKHNIPYWIDFGTLLGAVRHKGFIPWDDDIDICVLNQDYGKLRNILIEELPSQFVFQDTKEDPNAFFFYGRVRDKNSYCYYPHFTKLKEQGLWVDIFRVDKVGSIKMKKFADFFFRRCYHEMHHYGDVAYKSKYKRFFNRFFAYIIYPFSCVLVSLAKFLSNFNGKKYLARFAVNANNWTLENYVFPLCELEFEGHWFYAPHNYDAHLKIIYDDYMQLPPVEKRVPLLDIDKIKIW